MIRARGLTVVRGDTYLLRDVDLDLPPGMHLVCGASGSGKSTLLRALAGLSRFQGTVEGTGPAVLVGQEPADQVIAGTVAEELRLAGAIEPEPWLRRVGLDVPLHAAPSELSGGQQQRLAIAAALATGAPVLLLDEPFAHVDPGGSEDILEVLRNEATRGTTLLIAAHRLERLWKDVDQVVLLSAGRVVTVESAPSVSTLEEANLHPPAWLTHSPSSWISRTHRPVQSSRSALSWPVVRRAGRVVLHPGKMPVIPGGVIAVLGPNGAGKSTLLQQLAREKGAVWVPQDADLSLFLPTVEEELGHGANEAGVPVSISLADLGLDGAAERSPHALSKGQRHRLAMAAALATPGHWLLLDEPTAGQDGPAIDLWIRLVRAHLGDRTAVVVTHDLSLALRLADHVVWLDQGRVIADGLPGDHVAQPLPWVHREQHERGLRCVDLDWQTAGVPGGDVSTLVSWSPPVELDRPQPGATHVLHVAFVAALGTLAILLDQPASLLVLAVAGGGFLWSRRLPIQTRARVTVGAIVVAWSTMVSQGLFYGGTPRTVWVSIGPWPLYEEGLRWGVVQSARMVAVGWAGLALGLSTSPDRLVGLLRSFRIPSGWAVLAAMALRFVPDIGREAWAVRQARSLRGRPLLQLGPIGWARAEIGMLRPLVARTLRRAIRVSEVLDGRRIVVGGVVVPSVPWRGGDVLGVVMGSLLVACVAAAQSLTAAYELEVFYDDRLRPLYAWVHAWL